MEHPFDRVAVIVIDGVGCGEAEDTKSHFPEDAGANSLANASQIKSVSALTLQSMGLEYIPGLEKLRAEYHQTLSRIRGAFGSLEPTFAGNGSPEGHQALAGHIVSEPYLLFNRTGIPEDIVRDIEDSVARVIGREVRVIRYPGTDDVNGVRFIQHPDIGAKHLASKDSGDGPLLLPVYASSDSLVQVAVHQEVLPQAVIEEIGKAIRSEVFDEKGRRVARVIMRPFVGEPGNFQRVPGDRRDYASDPDGKTLADHLTASGVEVFGIGKAASMFNGRGFPSGHSQKLKDDMDRIRAVQTWFQEDKRDAFLMANLVETDELYGHPRKPKEYIYHINYISYVIGEIRDIMRESDLLIVTSDHGNDPTHTNYADDPGKTHNNHTRERVPILAFSPRIRWPVALGIRETYADCAKTIAEVFGIETKLSLGKSFLGEMLT